MRVSELDKMIATLESLERVDKTADYHKSMAIAYLKNFADCLDDKGAMINCGVNGRVAMEQVDLFPDVAQAWADSRDMIEKYQKSLIKKDDTQQQTQKRTMSDLSDQTGNSPILDGMNTDNGGDEDVHES